MSIQRDVTEQKKAEQKLKDTTERLREATALAERANEAKSQYVANLSHEFRTPLTSILGFAKVLLEDSAIDTEERRAVKQIASSADHLQSLMEDVLDLSKIEAGRIEIEPEPFDFAEAIQETVDRLRPQADVKNLDFRSTILAETPLHVMLDRRRIIQILTNLIGNAVKFTEKGKVEVRVNTVQPGNLIQIDVNDDGPGIPEDQLNRIFQPFQQVERRHAVRQQGIGLGLPITKYLIEAMNGTIEVASVPDEGSTFRVELPFSYGDVPANMPEVTVEESDSIEPDHEAGSIEGLAILAVDDHQANRILLNHILTRAGAEVVLAEDGESALEIFAKKAFDLVILDVLMPGINGYETAQRMRQTPEGQRVPILMLTAYAMRSDRDRSFEAGADAYLSKPFNPGELVHTVAKLVYRTSSLSDVALTENDASDPELDALRVEFLEHHIEVVDHYLKNPPGRNEIKMDQILGLMQALLTTLKKHQSS